MLLKNGMNVRLEAPWGVATAALGAYSAYEGSKGGKGATQETRQPQWMEDAGNFAVSRGREIANRPYQGYDGQRVADMSGNERAGIDMARRAVTSNDSRGYLDQAARTIDGVQPWSSDTMRQYMDPYVSGVVDQSIKRENESFAQRQYQNQGRAASVGAFGGDRAALIDAAETGRHLDTVGDITTRGYSDAFKSAATMWQADNDTKLRTADAYRAVGGDITRLNSNQITDLMRTGQADRVMRQMQLDVNYNDFLEQRDWQVTNLQPLLQAMGSSRGSSTTTRTGASGNEAGALLGAAATLTGYFGDRYGSDSGKSYFDTGDYSGIQDGNN